MNVTEFWYYLRTIGACPEASDWVQSFDESVTLEQLLDSLTFTDSDWLFWLIREMWQEKVTDSTDKMRDLYLKWVHSAEYGDMCDYASAKRDSIYQKYHTTPGMTTQILDQQLAELYAERDRLYAEPWTAFKQSIRADLLAELEQRV